MTSWIVLSGPYQHRFMIGAGAGTVTAKSVVFDVTDNWGDVNYMVIRSIEFFLAGELVSVGVDVDVTGIATTTYAGFSILKAFTVGLTKIGGRTSANSWLSGGGGTTNQRVGVVFSIPIEFDSIIINNGHSSGSSTAYGIKNTIITTSTDAITSTVYNEAMANSTQIFSGIIPEHVALDQIDDYTVPIVIPVVLPTTAKSVVFDFADNWGDGGFMSVRSVEFFLGGVLIPITAGFTAYATSTYITENVDNAFNTSLSKTGSHSASLWISASGFLPTNHRIIIVLDTPLEFDQIVINNGHTSGTETDWGIKNTIITTSTDAITSTVYNEAMANSTQIFSGIIPVHVALDQIDDYTVPIVIP